MTKLALILSPHPLLKQVSAPIEVIDKELQHFMDDMLETMYYQDGAGLAAVQVGVLKRIFVLDMSKKAENELNNPQFFINPEIIYCSEEQSVLNEGCLSFPGARAMLARSEIVRIKYLDYDGNAKELEADGWMARGLLHEYDHLNGITMPDHLSTMKKDVFLRHVKKFMRNNHPKTTE